MLVPRGPGRFFGARAQGEGAFAVPSPRGEVPVHVYRPAAWTPDSPVWIVMHGRKRDADRDLADWKPAAERRGALLLVPSFGTATWPASLEYPAGNVVDGHGRPVERSGWAFSIVDRIFEVAVRRAGSRRERFVLYGHGAGAQFVQRYVLFMGSRRVERAVAAGAGWYLLPDGDLDFPYGLREAKVSEATLRSALAAPLVVMVGLEDLETSGILRNNTQTLAQGATRVDRARHFVERGRRSAVRLGAPFHWRLVEVRGVGHRPGAMLPAAERVVMEPRAGGARGTAGRPTTRPPP